MTPSDLLTAAEVQAMLRCGRAEPYRLAKAGLLATVRWNRRVFFTRESVGLFLTRHTTPARRDFFRHAPASVHRTQRRDEDDEKPRSKNDQDAHGDVSMNARYGGARS